MTMFECWLCRTDALSAGVSIGARPRHASHTPVWAIHTYIDLHQPDDTTHDIHTGPYRHTSVTCSPIGLYRYSSTVAGNKEKRERKKKKEKRKKEKRKRKKGNKEKAAPHRLLRWQIPVFTKKGSIVRWPYGDARRNVAIIVSHTTFLIPVAHAA